MSLVNFVCCTNNDAEPKENCRDHFAQLLIRYCASLWGWSAFVTKIVTKNYLLVVLMRRLPPCALAKSVVVAPPAIHPMIQTSNPRKFFVIKLCSFFTFLILMGSAYPQAIINKLGSAFSMFNGADLSAWNKSGNASWLVGGNEVSVTQGVGFLVSRFSVQDIVVDFDYWVSEGTQASFFVRCTNPNLINKNTALEITLVNSPIQSEGAGSVETLLRANPTKVLNQWNHIQVKIIGAQLTVTLNGVNQQMFDSKVSAGSMAIFFGGGGLKLRNIVATIPGRW